MDIRTNEDRAESAFRALQKFNQVTDIEDEEPETQIADLLCNLQHYADEQGVDFQACLDRGNRNYEAEVQQEQQEQEA